MGKNVAIFLGIFFPKESFLGHVAWDIKKKEKYKWLILFSAQK